MYRSKIIACGSYHPENIVTNFDLEKKMDTSDKWIKERTGISARRIASDDMCPSDMAYHATKTAIEQSGLDVNDIDLILFSITYSEQSFPNTASALQKKLGITNNCPCLDINAACTGWMYGLDMADTYIKSGKYKNILLVGGEKPSTFLNWDDRNTAILFGDGCGVIVLARADESAGDKSAFHQIQLECNSKYHGDLALQNGGGLKPFTKADFTDKNYPFDMYMNGKIIFKEAVRTMGRLSKNVLQEENLIINDIDWLIPHQANMRIIETLSKTLEFNPDKILNNIADYGNTSSATIPTVLFEGIESGKIKRGDKILMTSFGAGLTSAAAVLTY